MQIPEVVEHIQWPFLIGAVVLAGAFATGMRQSAKFIKSILAPIREFIAEHDVLWEDYNIRTGGSYRRSTGRGNPPEPEEFYREHHGGD